MGLFKNYATDKGLEIEGVVFTPDSTTAITIARAGGANVKFGKLLEKKAKPFRRQIEAGTIDPDLDRKMMIECYADAIIRNWETLIEEDGEPKLVPGIEANPEAPDGTYSHNANEHGLVPYNRQNVIATLTMLPDLFVTLQQEAQSVANFRSAEREEDAKN